MIQDIAPHRLHNEFAPSVPRPDDLVFAFTEGGQKVFLGVPGDAASSPALWADDNATVTPLALPRVQDYIRHTPARLSALRWLFRLDAVNMFLDTADGTPALPDFSPLPTRIFRRAAPPELAFAGATARHLHAWYTSARFCGRCGASCVPDEAERAMRCPSCGYMIYPRINPAVIIGVTNGDKIILSRYADGHRSSVWNAGARTYKGRSLVAGYCEIGETVEETVRREVFEEVGLQIKNISYYKSQPWGFDGALLMGFFCEVDGDDTIRRDPSELAEAVWCARAEIGEVPGFASLTNEMIRKFRDAS